MSEKKTCCAKVYPPGTYSGTPCGKTAKFERNGEWYCGTHDPVKVEERKAARKTAGQARWNAEMSAHRAELAAAAEQKRRADCFDDLLSVLEEIVCYVGGANTALDDEYLMERTYDAIAKARGETK